MEAMPKITVVTVTRNAEKTLEETILSVVGQTYANVEYIVVDGGSTDGTLDIVRKYGERIDRWVSEPDRGIYDAMNKGIALATGEWINFMNAGDTFVSERTLEKVFDRDYREYDFIYGDRVYKDWTGLFVGKARPFWSRKSFCPAKGVCHQSTFVKASVARSYPFSLQYKYSGDYEMMLNVYRARGKFLYRPVAVAIYDVTGGFSISGFREGKVEDAKLLGIKRGFFFRAWLEYVCLRHKSSRLFGKRFGIRLRKRENFDIHGY